MILSLHPGGTQGESAQSLNSGLKKKNVKSMCILLVKKRLNNFKFGIAIMKF